MTDEAPNRSGARAIATRNIMLNTALLDDPSDISGKKHYLLAGGHQFRTLWARDFCFATPGALAVGATKAVKDSLEALFRFQRPDGLLPRGLDNHEVGPRVVLGLLGMPPAFGSPLKAWFETEYKVCVLDSNVLIPWAANQYIQATGDREFAQAWFPSLERAFQFLEDNGHIIGELIGNQPPFADWADSVRRTGRVSFTNVLYVMALRGAAEWALFLGLQGKASYYYGKAARVNAALLEHFWDPKMKALRNFDGNDCLTADANLMAIAQRILPEDLARQALQTLRNSPLWSPFPGRATTPDYPMHLKGFNIKLVGITGYHDSNYWLWLTALAAMAEHRLGNRAECARIMDALSDQIVKDGDVYEIFDLVKDGVLKPVRRLPYRAESPFTWSSGMYLEAAKADCVTARKPAESDRTRGAEAST